MMSLKAPNMQLSKHLSELKKICGVNSASILGRDQFAYHRDCSVKDLIKIKHLQATSIPTIIVWPKNKIEIQKILIYAKKQGLPVIPFGAGSGVCGSATPLQACIMMDVKKLDQILEINKEELYVTAEAGIYGEILERKLNRAGYTLGHFPSSIYCSTLGGYLACRSAGQLSNKYGKIEDMMISLEVILSTGEILKCGSEKSLDLKEIFVGSEGCLGVFSEASLRIWPLAESKLYRGVEFPNMESAHHAMRVMIQSQIKPAVARLYDPLDSTIFFFKKKAHTNSKEQKNHPYIEKVIKSFTAPLKSNSLRFLLQHPGQLNQVIDFSLKKCLLILGFEGPEWKNELEQNEALKICKNFKGKDLGEEPGLKWLRNRYSISYKMSPMIDIGCFADTFEVSASWNHLAPLYEAVKKAVSPHALIMAHFSHIYHDGACIYFTFASTAENLNAKLEKHSLIWKLALEACSQAGGTISHHHGVGTLKAKAFAKEMGPLLDYYKKMKQSFDPQNLFNPGKMALES